MKLQNTFLTLIILFVSFQFCFGQEKSKAELIDEFSLLSCDETVARVDNFVAALKTEPSSKGFVITYGKKGQHLLSLLYEQRIKNSVKGPVFNQFDVKRVTFVHGKSDENLLIQLWKIPVNGNLPAYKAEGLSYSLAHRTKPYIFNATTWNDDICPPTTDSELYSKLLSANPNYRGNLVIKHSSAEKFRQTKNDLLKEIVETHKITRNRLRFFYVKKKLDYPQIEFWIIPPRKK